MKPMHLFYYLARMLAALTVLMIMFSCRGTDSPTPLTSLSNAPLTAVSEYDLNGFKITTTAFPAHYDVAEVVVSVNSIPCASRIPFVNLEPVELSGACGDGAFSLNLLFVPASGPCQPGGLYLLSGSVTAPGDGPTLDYMNFNLAGWNATGQVMEPWLTPFDVPELVNQTSIQQWTADSSLSTLGLWTYRTVYRSRVIPPIDCTLTTNLALTLTPSDENISPRIFHYVVTEANTAGGMTAEISANEPDAPTAFIELDENQSPQLTRQLTFERLDFLRDAKANVSIEFVQPPQVLPHPITFVAPISPRICIYPWVDITKGYPRSPLATHLARFFSSLTSPIVAASGESTPIIPVKISASLSTPQVGGLPPMTIPLVLADYYSLTPGKDDKSNCAEELTPGLSCALAEAMENAPAAPDPPDPSASYVLQLTFYGGPEGAVQPLHMMSQAIVPLSQVSEQE